MALEKWTLRHPELGLIEVEFGNDNEFRQVYPDWPAEQTVVSAAGSGTRLERWKENLSRRAQIKVEGEIVRRYLTVENRWAPLTKYVSSKLSTMSGYVNPRTPNLKFQKGLLGDIQLVTFSQAGEVVELDPPPGSRGEVYAQAVQSSVFKRTTLPIVAGLGKAGWALALLVIGPLVGRVFAWLLSLLPEFDLPDLPSPPTIDLPELNFPKITLPVPDLSWVTLPDLPDWVYILLEYSKIWIPVVAGIFFGAVALRNGQKSRVQKSKWKASSLSAQPAEEDTAQCRRALHVRLARDIRGVIDKH